MAEDPDITWETVVLMEGSKSPVQVKRKIIRCIASRKDDNRNYVKPGENIWLYIRLYENGDPNILYPIHQRRPVPGNWIVQQH